MGMAYGPAMSNGQDSLTGARETQGRRQGRWDSDAHRLTGAASALARGYGR